MQPNHFPQAQLFTLSAPTQPEPRVALGRAPVPEAALREATLHPTSATEFVLQIPPNEAYPEGLELHIKHRAGCGNANRTQLFQIERRTPSAPQAPEYAPVPSLDGATEVRRPAHFATPVPAERPAHLGPDRSYTPLAPLHSEQIPPTRPSPRVLATRPTLHAAPRRGYGSPSYVDLNLYGPEDDTGPLFPLLSTPTQRKPPAFYR